jgi:trehalose synthase
VELIPVAARPLQPLADLIGEARTYALHLGGHELGKHLGTRTVWQVNSTGAGGGVAELLQGLLAYLPELEITSPWLTIDGDDRFFEITKRLHNRIHGAATGGELDEADAAHYEAVSLANARSILSWVRPGDVVILHDPQTAGMAAHLVAYGAVVVWRCHIGTPTPSEVADRAWQFLRPYITAAQAHAYSRPQYRPEFVPRKVSWTIRPSIDPLAAKNAGLKHGDVLSILRATGVLAGSEQPEADIVADELPDEHTPILTQVSRWDRLKDMRGVMNAFAEHVVNGTEAYLVLAGPQTNGVADDPEGAEVYAECRDEWAALPAYARRRVMLAALPMADTEANARMVNALQRHATVVAQKSLAEGFGLTVSEAMWKRRPVVGGAVGGIVDQIGSGSGILVDPTDPAAFGKAVRRLLDEPDLARSMGAAARERVYERFLPDIQLLRWLNLLTSLLP